MKELLTTFILPVLILLGYCFVPVILVTNFVYAGAAITIWIIHYNYPDYYAFVWKTSFVYEIT